MGDLSEAIRLNSKHALTYSNRGWVYLQKNELDRALKDLNEAIRLDPSHATSYAKRANVRLESHEWDKAFLDCLKVIELDPKNIDAYRVITWLYTECPDEKVATRRRRLRSPEKPAR